MIKSCEMPDLYFLKEHEWKKENETRNQGWTTHRNLLGLIKCTRLLHLELQRWMSWIEVCVNLLKLVGWKSWYNFPAVTVLREPWESLRKKPSVWNGSPMSSMLCPWKCEEEIIATLVLLNYAMRKILQNQHLLPTKWQPTKED